MASKKMRIALGFFLAVILIGIAFFYTAYQYLYRLKTACSQERVMLATGHKFNNAPSKEACEGKKIVDLETGTYQLGELTFKIPRAYLWQEKYTEGQVKNIYLSMYYPSFEPERADSNGLDPSLIHATIHQCFLKECNQKKTPDYDLKITIPRYKSTYSQSDYVPELDLWRYVIIDQMTTVRKSEVYFRGTQENPTYWFICTVSDRNPHCEGDAWFKNGSSISYRFHYSQLNDHEKIVGGIHSKIDNFLIKGAPHAN